ncbi:uncharacterized protein LOC122093700 isoform X1 [Macadamia integrifolia]|uniref:uncharacterized protein LOC122093700 isoform X1 n=2 Tax=Macadamia integrifolia TaxID=60698 RepID=UPI001C4F25B1|nr:uncharacterized protein LOC122093700 isoform X1 [Macadamia integrifolia]
MDKQCNLNRDELIAAAMAACSAGMLSMIAWYFTSEFVDEAETTGQHMTVDEEVNLDGIEEGMEASSEQTKGPPDSSLHSGGNQNKIHASHLIMETMNSVAANLGEIAEALDRNNKISIDNLYNEMMKIQDFDDELLVEALEYVASDDKKAMTFLTLNEKRRKNWLLKHLRVQSG